MSIKKKQNKTSIRIARSLRKLAERKKQDIEKHVDKPGWLFPPVRHIFSLKGNKEEQLGELSIHIKPSTPASERKLSELFLARFQRLIFGKNLPQKRVRPKHERDKMLVQNKKAMDRLVFKEIESIKNDKEFALADKKARKKLTQAKYRHHKLPSSQ